MKKNIFKDAEGNIHFGVNAPAGFQSALKEDVDKVLENLGDKKLWRCTVCNDLRIALNPLEECPTCNAQNAYVVIDLSEFKKLIEILIPSIFLLLDIELRFPFCNSGSGL